MDFGVNGRFDLRGKRVHSATRIGVGMDTLREKSHRKASKDGARERVLAAAYDLFAHNGTRAVGVDTIIAKSGVAKMSLYRHFRSKQDLVAAFLDRRETKWTVEWLRGAVERRQGSPEDRLLAIFEVFDGWFHEDDFEGCSFINVLLEYGPGEPLHELAAEYLAKIRAFLHELADQAGLADTESFAATWHILMKGSIVAAGEGNKDSARLAREAGRTILAAWPRRKRG
jgi:AcrR family transcriptional regulator